MGKSAYLGTAQEGIKCRGTCRFKLPSRCSSCLTIAVRAKQLKSGYFYCKEEFLMTILDLSASNSLSWGCKSFSYQISLARNQQCLELLPVDETLAMHNINILVFAKNLHQLPSLLPKQGLSTEQWNKGILPSGQKWGTRANLTVFFKPHSFQYHHPVGSPTINMHTWKGRCVNISVVFDEFFNYYGFMLY